MHAKCHSGRNGYLTDCEGKLAAKSLTEDELQDVLDLVEKHGNITEASRHTDLKRSTFDSRYQRARDVLGEKNASQLQDVALPEFPDDDISTEEIIAHLEKRWDKKHAHEQAKRWFEIKIKSDDPFGLVVVGDPHLGTHTNWALLKRDVDIMANTPGVGCLNIGDTVNNWGGRLTALYAEEDIGRKTERQLARWFLKEANVPWCCWLEGNHDVMNSEFATYLRAINTKKIPMLDWQAKFQLVFPSSTIRVDASHNHKGTSVYNPLHGQKRADLWGEDADIFVAGHHHTWALQQHENTGGKVVTYARARGYKFHDEFAHRYQFNEEQFGSSIIFIIDPTAPPNCRVKPFADLSEGAEFLTWKRSKR